MKEKLLAALKALGLIKDEDLPKVKAELDKIDEAPPIDTTKITDAATKQLIEALQQQVQLVTQQNKELLNSLAAEKKAREDATKIQTEQMKAENAKKVSAAVQKLLDDGKISSDDEKATWQKAFEMDFDIATKQSAQLSVKPGFKPKSGDAAKPIDKTKNQDRLPSPLDGVNTTLAESVKKFAQVTD